MRLETDRLVIRSSVQSDAPSLQRLFSDPDVRRWLPAGEPWTLERAQQAIEARIAGERDRGYAAWIVERKDGEFIGSCALQLVERKGPEIEIAYHYIPSAWGKGYGTEVAAAVLGYGFGTLGLERIIALAYPENVGSWRIMEKVGMRSDGIASYYGIERLKKYVVDRDAWRK